MIENQEAAVAVEDSAKERARLVKIIKERKPETLKQNLQESIRALAAFYLKQELPDNRLLQFFLKDQIRGKLKEKATDFYAYFNQNFFSKVTHWSSAEIPEALLKSSEKLAAEKGLTSTETSTQSGKLDQEIGNTDYVFANSEALTSRSAVGTSRYRISTQEGYVVPLDIAFVKSPDDTIRQNQALSENYNLRVYGKNLLTIPDFKVFFATYCAVFFDQPQDAIEFFSKNHYWPDLADCWDDSRLAGDDPDSTLKRKIRDLLVKSEILPPVSPEFQFKDQVQAKKVV